MAKRARRSFSYVEFSTRLFWPRLGVRQTLRIHPGDRRTTSRERKGKGMKKLDSVNERITISQQQSFRISHYAIHRHSNLLSNSPGFCRHELGLVFLQIIEIQERLPVVCIACCIAICSRSCSIYVINRLEALGWKLQPSCNTADFD